MPLERTVDVLLQLIARAQHADVAVLSNGKESQQAYARSLSVPLQASQHLFLGWCQPGTAPDLSASALLIEALQRVVAVNHQETSLHELLAEAACLQCKLADAKIADRTAGLIAGGSADPVDVQQHVHKVLASIEDATAVSERVARLRSELEDRKRMSAAKLVLQHKHGFTEQQAYVYLQQASRRSRRTIAEVASEVCGAERSRSRQIA